MPEPKILSLKNQSQVDEPKNLEFEKSSLVQKNEIDQTLKWIHLTLRLQTQHFWEQQSGGGKGSGYLVSF
jgi:hypothetical protein